MQIKFKRSQNRCLKEYKNPARRCNDFFYDNSPFRVSKTLNVFLKIEEGLSVHGLFGEQAEKFKHV